jgi:hypothetical protein
MLRLHSARAYAFVAALALVVSGAGPGATSVGAEDAPLLPASHQSWNGVIGPLTNTSGSGFASNLPSAPGAICSTATLSAANVNTDCEPAAPHNETSIAINPTNPLNMIGSANDYELTPTPGGYILGSLLSRAHVTFDGGRTWTENAIPYSGYVFTGDPAVAFDADGTAYLATLGFVVSQGLGCCTKPDVVIAHSGDGGKTWSTPTRVASGSGTFGSPGVFNDKEYLTAWGHGNAIVTWTVFNYGAFGSYISSPIFASVTHDGGKTWSVGTEISGSAPFCVGAQGGTQCNQDQASVPVVAADGSLFVAFLSTADMTTFRDRYLVVKVDPTTGQRTAGPYGVALLIDGVTDYPINIDGRQTYQDSQFRTWAAGNITADPTNAHHLAIVWSDMRNSTVPAPRDPYKARTNSDVVVSQSNDAGATWSTPVAIGAAGDQFMPWGAYDATGLLRIGYFDRSYDPANHAYGYTLAVESRAGSLRFRTGQLSTALSDPTRDAAWFSGRSPNPGFPHPTSFLGDYSSIASFPTAGSVALWTDMRVVACFPIGEPPCGAGEDAFFASR